MPGKKKDGKKERKKEEEEEEKGTHKSVPPRFLHDILGATASWDVFIQFKA